MTMEENNEPEIEDAAVDISAGQKMLSAVSGSLLTSLLGIILSSLEVKCKNLTHTIHSHPPRCRPCPPTIPIPTPTFILLPFPLILHQPPEKPRRNSLLSGSLLGKQHLPLLHSCRPQRVLLSNPCNPKPISYLHIGHPSGRLRSRRDPKKNIHLYPRWLAKDRPQ